MLQTPHRSAERLLPLSRAWFLPVCLMFGSGCCCPPCAQAPRAPEAGAPKVAAAAVGAKAAPAAQAAPTPSAPSGARILLWDGDNHEGEGKGWSDCEDKGNCKTQLEMVSDQGVDGSSAVHFHGEGAKWIGMGWNWFAWWPKDAGTDISPYDTLRFSLRIVVPDPNTAPAPATLSVALRSSAREKPSASVTLENYVRDPGDGKWHDVEVPLAEFYKGPEGKGFDPKSVWELQFGTWEANSRTFDVYLDEIAVFKK